MTSTAYVARYASGSMVRVVASSAEDARDIAERYIARRRDVESLVEVNLLPPCAYCSGSHWGAACALNGGTGVHTLTQRHHIAPNGRRTAL